MKRSSKYRCPAIDSRHPACYRPQLLVLEDRVPLGDALWGAVVGSWLMGSALPDSAPAIYDSPGATTPPTQEGRDSTMRSVTKNLDSIDSMSGSTRHLLLRGGGASAIQSSRPGEPAWMPQIPVGWN
jgi:hypothetical protein